MSIADLPPLPKSLSGINKMLGSDSGLISDEADLNADNQNSSNSNNNSNTNIVSNSNSMSNNNIDNKLEYQKEDNNNNKNNNKNSNSNSSNSSNNSQTNNNNANNMGKSDVDVIKGEEELNAGKSKTSNANTPAKTTTTTPKTEITTTAAAATTTTATPLTTGMSTAAATTPAKNNNAAHLSSAGGGTSPATTTTTSVTGSTLDTQLAILRKEMYGLRQLDLSLLSQLWALNDSIQEFRTIIESQEFEPDVYAANSATPSPYDSVSSDAEDDGNAGGDNGHGNSKRHKERADKPKIITTQPKLTQRSNSTASNRNMAAPPQRPSPPKAPDMMTRPVPRMRSAPPPPPTVVSRNKSAAPPRPT